MTAADYEITVRWSAARKAFAYLRTPSVCIRLHGPQASGSAYVAEGRDLVDYLDILDKFVVPDNWDLLQGFQTAITAHLAWRTSFTGKRAQRRLARNSARVDELTGRLASIPSWLPVTISTDGR